MARASGRWTRLGRLMAGLLLGLLFGGLLPGRAQAHETLQLDTPKPDLAPTPPMGWNSWNKYGCNISEAIVRAQADALVSSGLRDAGYRYLVIDDCWQKSRDADGNILADAERFPSGIAALAAYVHARGLKFGLYSDAGAKTCGGRPGSAGHEYQDARQYAKWGVDFLKYDWCHTGPRNAEAAYTIMAKALRASGRDILLSICEWGNNQPQNWAPSLGHMWRTTGDIFDAWAGKKDWSHGMTDILDMHAEQWRHGGPNRWPDPDMLEVGNGGMSRTEYEAHFSLWAMMAAPLIAGNDLSAMDADTRLILGNREVIAVDQDALGQPGRRLSKQGDLEVWARPLAGGELAVLLFNRGAATASISADWALLNLPAGARMEARNLWTGERQTSLRERIGATVPSHGVVMWRLALQR